MNTPPTGYKGVLGISRKTARVSYGPSLVCGLLI